MDYKCSEEQFKICEKSNLCHLCDGQRLFKKPKWMERKEKQDQKRKEGIRKKVKEGMGFEKRVQKTYNKSIKNNPASSPTHNVARRRPNSGAIWSMPGDIITPEELIECKERGSQTSKGEKQITIPKAHLDKVREEAYMAQKDVWYYVFGFKGYDNIYVVKDFEDELQMVQQIKTLKERIVELERGGEADAES